MMHLQRMLLGCVAGMALCSAVQAKPPGLPSHSLPEGRELDPVARDHYLADPLTAPKDAPAPSRDAENSSDQYGVFFMAILLDAITHDLTIPLGTVRPTNRMR